MKRDVVIVDSNLFLNFFTDFKSENVLCGSPFINESGVLSFYYLVDDEAMPFSINPTALVGKMGYDDYEVIFDLSEIKHKIMVWK